MITKVLNPFYFYNSMALNKINRILLFLFGTALLTSMAGMEILSSLILLTGTIAFFKKTSDYTLFGKEFFLFSALLATSILSLIINGLTSEIGPTLGWFRWIIIFYGILYCLVETPNGVNNLLKGILFGGLLSSINSIVQSITHRDWTRGNKVIDYYADLDKEVTRVTGFFNMPTTYGYIIAMALMVSLTLFIISSQKKYKFILSSIFTLGIVSLAFTYSRGAWIGFASGIFCFLFFKKIKLLIPIIAGSLVIGACLYSFSPGFQERIGSLTDFNYYSNSQRIELWRANLEIFKDHPLFGAGLNENDNLVVEYHEKLNHIEKYQSHAHNIYLQYLAGTGSLGFLSFIVLIFFFFLKNLNLARRLSGPQQTMAYGLLSIQTTFIVSGFFDCNFGDSEVRYSYLIYLILVLYLEKITLKKNLTSSF